MDQTFGVLIYREIAPIETFCFPLHPDDRLIKYSMGWEGGTGMKIGEIGISEEPG